MRDHIHCIGYDFRDGKITEPVKCCGWTLRNEDDCLALISAIDDVDFYVGKMVTVKLYVWLKKIADEREYIRYCTCINAGMSEEQARYAFS